MLSSPRHYLYGIVCFFLISFAYSDTPEDWLNKYAKDYEPIIQNYTLDNWAYETDLSDENQKRLVAAELELTKFQKKTAESAKHFTISKIKNPTTRRAFDLITNIGISASPDQDKIKKIATLLAEMSKIYSSNTAKINGEYLPLQPYGLSQIMAQSRDYDELKLVWKSWRDVSGKKMRKNFIEWVKVSNEAIDDGHRFDDFGQFWRSVYGEGFQESIDKLMKEIMPLYKLFHAYVRQKLKGKYGDEHFSKDGTIPAHLLGDMWAQEWNNIENILLPYNTSFDVTEQLKKQKYTVQRMFELSEEFFTSLGLKNMTKTFWEKSIKKKIKGKKMVCHASAWDFYKEDDFRIKMCTEITMEDLTTIHHEMGHIQYFQQYADQPIYFRDGANPGFHEAVGDTLALSVSTPKHLKKIGLLNNYKASEENTINFLMRIALKKLVFLPFSYVVDNYRWNLFNGKTPTTEYNAAWWKMRCQHQGLSPPVPRSEEDFDPGAKMHIASGIPYIRYFVAHIIQFQFHEALCKEAGFKGELHHCDIYKSKKAGTKLANMLKMGSSKSWPEAMKAITGQTKMSAESLLNYLKPLEAWLEKHVDKKDIGWECPTPNSASTSNGLLQPILLLASTMAYIILKK
ncbi:angiotensin-converting enzyme-like [Argonauta hians]